jgi:KDO2-lipid IV(A) lauroyltransferase
MKKFLSVIAYRSVYGIIYSISLIPMSLLYGFSSLMYVFVYHLLGYRKAVVIQNISRSFPEKRYGEVRDVVRKFYVCFTAYFAEVVKTISISPQKLDQKLTFVNLALIDEHIRSGKNVIVCLGHCGNWEMLNFMPYKLSYDMYAVYKPLKSKTVNQLMIQLRSRFGMKLITHKTVVRHILTKKESSSVYLFLADQCPRRKEEKYRFDLLNQTSYHFSGMEKLARLSRSAVVYLHITQSSKGNYKIACVPVCAEPASTDEGEITRKYVDLLTENIKAAPSGWLWTHKRWKR